MVSRRHASSLPRPPLPYTAEAWREVGRAQSQPTSKTQRRQEPERVPVMQAEPILEWADPTGLDAPSPGSRF